MNFLEVFGYKSQEKTKEEEKAKLLKGLADLEQWLSSVEMGMGMRSGASGEARAADNTQIQRIKELIEVKKQQIAELEK